MARRRSQRRYRDKSPRLGWPPAERDWAELHPDLILCILHRLDQVELLIGGVAGVCRSWRRAAREEPELWRRIDLSGGRWYVPPFRPEVSLYAMVRAALRFAAGQCEAFLSERIDDELLLVIARRAPSLKSLHLITGSVSNKGFAKAVKMLPLLEELEISHCKDIDISVVVELVAGTCSLMKHLRLVTRRNYQNGIALSTSMVGRMHKLRSLHLVGLDIDNEGMTTILDSCQNLEYINMRHCSPIVMDDNLRLKLARINMDNREYSSDYYNHYEYWFNIRVYHPYSCECIDCRGPYRAYNDDSHESYYYCIGGANDVDDAELEDYEKILDIKSMRRYLS